MMVSCASSSSSACSWSASARFCGDIQRFLEALCPEANLSAREHCQTGPNQRSQQDAIIKIWSCDATMRLRSARNCSSRCRECVIVRMDRSLQLVALQLLW